MLNDEPAGDLHQVDLTLSLPEFESGPLPDLLEVFRLGEVVPLTSGGTIVADQTLFDAWIRARDEELARGRKLPVDYEHQTRAVPPLRAPAAAWIDRLDQQGDALLAHVETWTDMGAADVRNKRYRYISPSGRVLAATDPKTKKEYPARLDHLALTNTPGRTVNPSLWLKSNQAEGIGRIEEEDEMDWKKKLASVLKLKAEATDEDVLEAVKLKVALADKAVADLKLTDPGPEDLEAAIEKLSEPPAVDLKQVLPLLDLDPEKAVTDDATGAIIRLKAGPDGSDMAARLKALEDETTSNKVASELDKHQRRGAISAKQRDQYAVMLKANFKAASEAMDDLPKGIFPAEGVSLGGDEPAAGGETAPEVKLKMDAKLPLSADEQKIYDGLAKS